MDEKKRNNNSGVKRPSSAAKKMLTEEDIKRARELLDLGEEQEPITEPSQDTAQTQNAEEVQPQQIEGVQEPQQTEEVQGTEQVEQSQEEVPQEEQPEEADYRQKREIDQKIEENSNISRVDADEIKRLMQEIEGGEGEKSEEAPKPEEKITQEELEAEAEAEKQEKELEDEKLAAEEAERRAMEANRRAGDYSIPRQEEKQTEQPKPKKHRLFEHEHGNLPPAESLPDDITDAEIQEVLEEQEKQTILAEELEEQESYEGMTEEEIADAKERKRKFAELKLRYNSKDQNASTEMGDYKKNLDFSINTSVKRFKLKPPKKPFIITACIVAFLALVSGLIAYFIINKPPEPVVLSSVQISQPSTNQTVGQKVDISGIYVTETYSDGSTKKVFMTESMITAKTSNIASDLTITAYRADTSITFTIHGKELVLKVNLNERRVKAISVDETISIEVLSGGEIKFEDLIIWADIEYYVGSSVSQNVDKMWVRDFENVSITVVSSNTALAKTSTGFTIPSELSGSVQIRVTYTSGGRTFSTTTNITIV